MRTKRSSESYDFTGYLILRVKKTVTRCTQRRLRITSAGYDKINIANCKEVARTKIDLSKIFWKGKKTTTITATTDQQRNKQTLAPWKRKFFFKLCPRSFQISYDTIKIDRITEGTRLRHSNARPQGNSTSCKTSSVNHKTMPSKSENTSELSDDYLKVRIINRGYESNHAFLSSLEIYGKYALKLTNSLGQPRSCILLWSCLLM